MGWALPSLVASPHEGYSSLLTSLGCLGLSFGVCVCVSVCVRKLPHQMTLTSGGAGGSEWEGT